MNVRELYTDTIVSAVQPATSGTINPSDWFIQHLNGGRTNDSGVDVNGTTVLTSGPVYQAVSIIAGDVGQLPIHCFRQVSDREKQRDRRHPGDVLLTQTPHPELLPSTVKETLQAWALLWGNGVAKITRNNRGEPTSLTPLAPDCTWIDRDEDDQLWYMHTVEGRPYAFRPDDVLHIRGLGDPLWGYSVIDLARNSFGHNLALQKHGNKVFSNGARPSGVLEMDGRMAKEDRDTLRREWNDMHRGAENAHNIAILQQGLKFSAMSVTNEASQWLESRRFSREEVAAWFNLPPHKLGSLENSSVRANLEEQNRDYLNTTLNKWLKKWEEECERKLLSMQQRRTRTHFFRFITAALLRADIKSRYEAYATGMQWGWESINDVLDKEDRNGIGPAGDVRLRPLNMEPIVDHQDAMAMPGEKAKQVFEAYGAAVRAGTITPMIDDENHFRGILGLPPVTADVVEAWRKDEGTRRPITLKDTMVDKEKIGDDEQAQQAPPETSQARAAVALIARAEADRMCRTEEKQLVRCAKKDGNFCDHVSEFYDGWRSTLTGAMRTAAEAATVLGVPVGNVAAIVADYCDRQTATALNIAGAVTSTADLAEAIETHAGGWQARSHSLTLAITKGVEHESVSDFS